MLPTLLLLRQPDWREWQLRRAEHARQFRLGSVPSQLSGEAKQERDKIQASERNMYAEFHPAHGVLESGNLTRRRGIHIGVGQT